MVFEGRIYKDGKFWLVDMPLLGGLVTQGRTKGEARLMAQDFIESSIGKKGVVGDIATNSKDDSFFIVMNDPAAALAFLFRKIRESKGLTIMAVAERMGSKSPTAYARYEQGKVVPTIAKLYEILDALESKTNLVLRAVA